MTAILFVNIERLRKLITVSFISILKLLIYAKLILFLKFPFKTFMFHVLPESFCWLS